MLHIYTKILYIILVAIQIIIPHIVGNIKLSKVHLLLPVSFFIERRVVVHGKCNTVKIITLIAVRIFQPFADKIPPIAV